MSCRRRCRPRPPGSRAAPPRGATAWVICQLLLARREYPSSAARQRTSGVEGGGHPLLQLAGLQSLAPRPELPESPCPCSPAGASSMTGHSGGLLALSEGRSAAVTSVQRAGCLARFKVVATPSRPADGAEGAKAAAGPARPDGWPCSSREIRSRSCMRRFLSRCKLSSSSGEARSARRDQSSDPDRHVRCAVADQAVRD